MALTSRFLFFPGILIASVLPSSPAQGAESIAEASENTPQGGPFSSRHSPEIPSLAEGGFALEPSFVETFEAAWPGPDWRVANWLQNGTEMAPERCRSEGGTLVQTVLAGEPYRGGSVQTAREFGYGRWLARVRPTAVPGALNSVFIKDWDDLATPSSDRDGSMAEVDIEFLSKTFGPGRGEVHLAIHLKDRMNLWSRDIPLDFNPSEEFHVWGFDLLPDRVVWHVDGRQLAVWEADETHFINPGYEFFLNSWTKDRWIGGPPEEDADYLVDWVRFHPRESAAAPVEPYLADYPGGRSGALSFTFDDGFRHQVENTLEIIEPLGIRGTFFLIPAFMDGPEQRDNVIDFDQARALLAAGHEVGTHGTIQKKLHEASDEELDQLINGSWQLLASELGTAPLSYAAPGGSRIDARVEAVIRERHAFIRKKELLPRARIIGYGNTDFRQWDDLATRAKIEEAIATGGWVVPIVHAIVAGWSPFRSKEEFRGHCEWIASRSDDLWIAPMGEVGRYVFTRDAAELTLLEADESSVSFSISHKFQPKGAFSEFLTVVVPVAGAEEASARSEAGKPLPVTRSDKALLVDAPVDGSVVRLDWRTAEPPAAAKAP